MSDRSILGDPARQSFELSGMVDMRKRIAGILSSLLLLAATPSFGQANAWAIWVDLDQQPHGITVAPQGYLTEPWVPEGGLFAEQADAWKRVCWLTRNGGIYGQKFESVEMLTNKIECDDNCNCRV